MGVYLAHCQGANYRLCFPHACGGVPILADNILSQGEFSPRMWGCTSYGGHARNAAQRFPHACGGVPCNGRVCHRAKRFPHACGGVPNVREAPIHQVGFSPRMWGCTVQSLKSGSRGNVFPTHVGVYHESSFVGISENRFPHACGGVPCRAVEISPAYWFSPRMWGCTCCFCKEIVNFFVFPTHVGVYPIQAYLEKWTYSFPHACGGVPNKHGNARLQRSFSPRMWGCTCPLTLGRPTPSRFPHACGGVPLFRSCNTRLSSFPHACGGVPTTSGTFPVMVEVFPTHVGVYRNFNISSVQMISFPHACGGVP